MGYSPNLSLLEEKYDLFKKDPQSLDPTWRAFFAGVDFGEKSVPSHVGSKEIRIYHLIDAYRTFGHFFANINPIAAEKPKLPYELTFEALGFKEAELPSFFPTLGLLQENEAPLEKIIEVLQEIYCRTIGIEYMHLPWPKCKQWLQDTIEPHHFRPTFSNEKKKVILGQLIKATSFESFLQTKYVGQKRFSLEGGETLIPILHEIIETTANLGSDEVVIGMAHRGRLNVLTNVLNKSYSMVFSEFEGYYDKETSDETSDVKYHKGFSSNVLTDSGKEVHVSLSANPSHLESVDPVVMGKVFAKQKMKKDEKKQRVLPILIHGDASIAGQGVVYETLQLYNLDGYSTGGTIHIIVNNQIGFTTLPKESRSTFYCTSLAPGFSAPVFHVNAEDPEGCVFATQLACQIRQKYHCDVFIDLNCYRKYGHNESDEPFFTQPIEYKIIKSKKPIKDLYLESLDASFQKEAQQIEEEFSSKLHRQLEELKALKKSYPSEAFGGVWQNYRKATKEDLFQEYTTAVDEKVLRSITETFCTVPSDFNIHPKVQRLFQDRLNMLANDKIDWAMAEHLAFASLLNEGRAVRLAGQDVRRGTFSQRHAVWIDQNSGENHFPLKSFKASFDVIDSPLSEFAALGFEYGYSLSDPAALVLWEAQYGDFSNGAQVIIDQYIVSGELKWSRYSGLCVLLPHGFEGQGPEHSSGRMERFLQLCGAGNIQVVSSTTPAQYFHLLRRQLLRPIRKPLIIFSHKALLRHPKCISPLKDFTNGTFQEIIADSNFEAKRVILCNGRVYYDLLEKKPSEIALVRLEELYPLATDDLANLLLKYKQAKEIFWVQEEPENMGAWLYLYPTLQKILPQNTTLKCVARKRSGVTAVGSHAAHVQEHEELMKAALGFDG